jgi:tripartite-type tricarboxylate transporter receptor subunit TctC
MRKTLVVAALAAALIAGLPWFVALQANAQDYPARPITLVMPYPPGGGTDFVGRLLAQKLEQRLGQTIVLEYRPGAASAIAATYVSRQPADGYTILYATSTTMAINVSVHKKLNYDPTKDLTPIAMIAVSPFVLVVNPSLPIHSVADITKAAITIPGGLSYASNGPGGAAHLFAELLKTMLGIPMTHVPYKGNAPALNDVVAGHVSLMFVDPSAAIQLARQGKLRALGVSTAKRAPIAPELPPLSEVGLPGYDAASWHMFVAPGATPKAILQKLNAEMNAIVNDPAVGSELTKRGFVPTTGGSPDQLVSFVKSEIDRWGKVVRTAGAGGIQ